jgi:cell division protein FtsB
MQGRSHDKPDDTAKRRRLRVRPAYLVLAVFLALFAYKFLQKTREIRGLARQEAALRWQNQQTARQNAALQRAILYDRTMPYVEDQAREIFWYSKPGDILVGSVPTFLQPRPMVRVAPPRPAAPPEPTWKQWWKAFFG